jgi:hypothetical protein
MSIAPDAIADSALITLSTWQRTPRSRTMTVRILHLDGRLFASAGFLPPYQPGAKWDWIRETVARECECAEDDVGCDDDDQVTVEGIPLFRVQTGCDGARPFSPSL